MIHHLSTALGLLTATSLVQAGILPAEHQNRLGRRSVLTTLKENGQVTQYGSSNTFEQFHCSGNVAASASFKRNINPSAIAAFKSNGRWVAVNDVNLGGGEPAPNCGKCVTVSVFLHKQGSAPFMRSIGPLLIADRCYECADNSIDLWEASFKALQIPNRGSIQPQQNDGGTTVMKSKWKFVPCTDPFQLVDLSSWDQASGTPIGAAGNTTAPAAASPQVPVTPAQPAAPVSSAPQSTISTSSTSSAPAAPAPAPVPQAHPQPVQKTRSLAPPAPVAQPAPAPQPQPAPKSFFASLFGW